MDLLTARLLFGFLFWLLLGLPVLVVFAIPESWMQSNLFRLPAVIYFFAWHLGASWLANRAARHCAIDNRSFGDSFWEAVSDARVPLSFVPVIGGLFVQRRNHGDREL